MQPPDPTSGEAPLSEWMSTPALLDAWRTVRRGGHTSGVDGVSPALFARDAERRVAGLATRLRGGSYHASPYLRLLLPKLSGGFRPIAVPTVEDRIAQLSLARAVGNVVGSTYSAASYAYRPKRGPRRAAEHLLRLLKPDSWVVVTDIESFFDDVDHEILMSLLRAARLDSKVLHVFHEWLTVPVVDRGYRLQPMKGVPQGSPASPLLANLYLTAFDRVIEQRGWQHVRYADDFVIVAGSRDEAAAIVAFIGDWLWRERRLRLKAEKTAFVAARQGFRFVGLAIVPGSCEIPESQLATVRARITMLLADPVSESMARVLRSHNALVRGWRNYYSQISPVVDRQLAELDRWRRDSTEVYARALEINTEIAGAVFESFEPPTPCDTGLLGYAGRPSPPPRVEISEVGLDPWHVSRSPFAPVNAAFLPAADLAKQVVESAAPTTLLEDGTLMVPSHGAYLTRLGGLLALRRKKTTLFACADEEVRHVVLAGPGTLVSTSALLALAGRGTPVTVCEHSGKPIARLVSVVSERRPRLIEDQVAARNDERGLAIAKALVIAKIRNQRALLLYAAKYGRRSEPVRTGLTAAAAALSRAILECRGFAAQTLEMARKSLFLLEARSATRYWRAIAPLVPADWGFRGRRGRGAKDPMNSLLNYGYWRLSTAVWRAIEGEELHPFIGFLHTSRHAGAGLVYDAMEEFRPVLVDRTILAMVGRGTSVVMRKDGRLTTATRLRVDCALTKTALRKLRGRAGGTLRDAIPRQAMRLRLAISEGRAYRGFCMTW